MSYGLQGYRSNYLTFVYFQLYRQHAVYPDYFHPNISKYWGDLIKDFHKIIEFDGLWMVSINRPAKD